jgi:hypothetical protein
MWEGRGGDGAQRSSACRCHAVSTFDTTHDAMLVVLTAALAEPEAPDAACVCALARVSQLSSTNVRAAA